MFKAAEVFGRLAFEVGTELGYEYSAGPEEKVTAYLNEIRKLERR
jgi:hypothetical protein